MFHRILHLAFKTIACAALALSVAGSTACFVIWLQRPSPNSAEALLQRADELAWNNDWGRAFPLFVRAQALFEQRRDFGHALYAKVSQVPG
jgi:hypothetical protein